MDRELCTVSGAIGLPMQFDDVSPDIDGKSVRIKTLRFLKLDVEDDRILPCTENPDSHEAILFVHILLICSYIFYIFSPDESIYLTKLVAK